MSKDLHHWQTEILYDEMQGPLSHKRFSDWEKDFIKSLLGKFFNDPEYKLSDRQKQVLQDLWDKD